MELSSTDWASGFYAAGVFVELLEFFMKAFCVETVLALQRAMI